MTTFSDSYYGQYTAFKILDTVEQVNEHVKDKSWVMLKASDDLKLFLVGLNAIPATASPKADASTAGSTTSTSSTNGKKSYCKDYVRKDGTTFVGCGKEIKWGKVDGRPKPLNMDDTPHIHEASTK